jgi:hypothetical protein
MYMQLGLKPKQRQPPQAFSWATFAESADMIIRIIGLNSLGLFIK